MTGKHYTCITIMFLCFSILIGISPIAVGQGGDASFENLSAGENPVLARVYSTKKCLSPFPARMLHKVQIAGKCLSANTVSGDFFDYLQGENEIAIVVGDVTGHGMQGAMNAVMTDGIIEAKDNTGTEYQDTGRLRQVLGSFTPETSAETMVSALINDATTFGRYMTTQQEDDITVVVVKVN